MKYVNSVLYKKALVLMDKQSAFQLMNRREEVKEFIPGTKNYTKEYLSRVFAQFEELLRTPVIKVNEINY